MNIYSVSIAAIVLPMISAAAEATPEQMYVSTHSFLHLFLFFRVNSLFFLFLLLLSNIHLNITTTNI